MANSVLAMPPGHRSMGWEGESDGDTDSDWSSSSEQGPLGAADEEDGGRRAGRPGPPREEDLVLLSDAVWAHATQKETIVDGRLVVWTDGAARIGKEEPSVAAGGVFFAEGDRRNRTVPVDGAQTSQRAELTAALSVLREQPGPLELRTDSEYVASGMTRWSRRWVARALYRSPAWARPIRNADLWHKLLRAVSLREEPVVIRWVKAHPVRSDVETGRTTLLDVWGNTRADEWAKKGLKAMRP